MEEKKMKKEILKTVEAYLLTNREFISESEITGLKAQITHLKHEIYVEQLKAFRKHLEDAFEELMSDDSTDASVDSFYNSEFKINWRGKTVTLGNGAEVFQGIEEIIQNEIDNEEV